MKEVRQHFHPLLAIFCTPVPNVKNSSIFFGRVLQKFVGAVRHKWAGLKPSPPPSGCHCINRLTPVHLSRKKNRVLTSILLDTWFGPKFDSMKGRKLTHSTVPSTHKFMPWTSPTHPCRRTDGDTPLCHAPLSVKEKIALVGSGNLPCLIFYSGKPSSPCGLGIAAA